DDLHGATVDGEDLADDGGVGTETLFPEAVAQDNDFILSIFAVFGPKAESVNGSNSQDVKEIYGHVLDDDLFGVAVASKVAAHVGNGRHSGENVVLFPPVGEVGRTGDIMKFPPACVAFPDHNQFLRALVRQSSKEDGVDDGENGGVGTDAESQGQHGNGRESG